MTRKHDFDRSTRMCRRCGASEAEVFEADSDQCVIEFEITFFLGRRAIGAQHTFVVAAPSVFSAIAAFIERHPDAELPITISRKGDGGIGHRPFVEKEVK